MALISSLGAELGALSLRPPVSPSPETGNTGAKEGGWGPGSVTTHLRPPRSSPRAAAAARSPPWPETPGGRGPGAREAVEPSRLRDEAPSPREEPQPFISSSWGAWLGQWARAPGSRGLGPRREGG